MPENISKEEKNAEEAIEIVENNLLKERVEFSLSAILRLLRNLDNDNNVDIKHIIDTPKENEDIVSVCDKLLTSLENAEDECNKMIIQIKKMKKINPPV